MQVAKPLSGCCQPRLFRPGAGWKPFPAPLITIARDKSFSPTRSTRTPLVTSLLQYRLDLPAPWTTNPFRKLSTSLPSKHHVGSAYLLGPPPILPREEEHSTPHPRCLPSKGSAPKGSGSNPRAPFPASGYQNRRLFNHCFAPHLDKV